ncbi:fizzy-related protein homolog [Drosophila miranda]|uniref:fizzy-related protein homolog n=1 Tax=Drosophila miranda TaxID=7229 RepID=UPI00143F4E59|nr:fizzy-related protein homolog [Drosophila miranda]
MFQPEYEKRLLQGLGIPGASGREHSDLRCIPSRARNNWERNYHLTADPNPVIAEQLHNSPYACLLRNELLDSEVSSIYDCKRSKNILLDTGDFTERENIRVFGYGNYTPPNKTARHPFSRISEASRRLLCSPTSAVRRVTRLPYKVLDAPELQDDFYLNALDWSSKDILGVGLGCSLYLWSAVNSQVTRLCDLSDEDNLITAVKWHSGGKELAVGTNHGSVAIWDVDREKQISNLSGHISRVTALDWRGNSLASGSRDRSILQRDIRTNTITSCLQGHSQEVCGLQWSPTWEYLASGGNDNRLLIWTAQSPEPLHKFTAHNAAVKALGWSPHKSGLLASGGGSADRCLRFWNVISGQMVQSVDTGAQISNLAWSRNSAELVTTHGFGQPQIVLWRYPSLKQVVNLSGHNRRVIYLAVSPDGKSIVTGGGDETLRFWNVFTERKQPQAPRSALSLFSNIR